MLQKLGEQLQQARQARGVSLEDAERIIRIRRKYLAALERGDHLALPTPLQVRGFLQSYSTYLGLDVSTRRYAVQNAPFFLILIGTKTSRLTD